MKRKLCVAIAALLLGGGAVAQQEPGDYRLGPKDLVEVRVLEVPELNVERRVSESGELTLPILGDVPATGLTADELASRIGELLRARYVTRANVSVIIREFANQPISVLGAVQKPGSLTVSGQFTLLQAISAAGGLTERAGKRIHILRRDPSGQARVTTVSVADLFGESATAWNTPVYPSDVINVPARSVVKIYCLGEVNQPAELAFDNEDRITLLSAIAKAGGVTDRASNRVVVKRRGADGKDTEQTFNYERIINGSEPDPSLMADDVVVVLMSFF